MKTATSFKSITLAVLLGTALTASVMAQPGPGMGGGMGMGRGMGMGGGPGMRGMGFNQNNSGVWSLMTPEERTANQIKMRAVKTYDECKLVQTEQRTLMESRAKEKGITLPTPPQNGCDNMKARGLIK